MNHHANAPLGPKGRAIMVRRVLDEGFALAEAAEAAGVSAKTAGKWVRRYRAEGEAGLLDRSRRGDRRMLGRSWAKAGHTGTDAEGVRRLQTGWERVHVCVDDATAPRLRRGPARREGEDRNRLPETSPRLLPISRHHGGGVDTDNGSAYRSAAHALACQAMGIRHIRTQPYRPQTNGKAERFIRTMLREWAYAAIYGSSPLATGRLFSGYGSSAGTTWLASTTRPAVFLMGAIHP